MVLRICENCRRRATHFQPFGTDKNFFRRKKHIYENLEKEEKLPV